MFMNPKTIANSGILFQSILKPNDEIKKFILKISTAEDNNGGDGAILIKLKKL